MVASYLAESFDDFTFKHISKVHITDADELAQIASETQLLGHKLGREIPVSRQVISLPSLLEQKNTIKVCAVEALPDDWRRTIMRYIDNPNEKHDRRTRVHATNYVLYQNEMYRKGKDWLLLMYLGPQEAVQAMAEVHEGIYGAHQSGRKIRWLLRRHGYFWPSILKDCIKYAKACV
ncbi:hypothetical protein ACFX2B_027738 [Malus domestica]